MKRLVPQFWAALSKGELPPEKSETTRKYEGRFDEIFRQRSKRHGRSLTKDEVYTLYSSAVATRELDGAIAEVGVYRGGSARVICEVKRDDKPIYLFDTFEGMPDEKISDRDTWETGTHTKTSADLVREYLEGFSQVHLVKGLFPDSVSKNPSLELENERFSLVHLDVDLYESTLDGLEFFYPRVVEGGRIISHNYNLSPKQGGDTPGVKTAFMEYFKGQEHKIVEVADTQCLVIK